MVNRELVIEECKNQIKISICSGCLSSSGVIEFFSVSSSSQQSHLESGTQYDAHMIAAEDDVAPYQFCAFPSAFPHGEHRMHNII